MRSWLTLGLRDIGKKKLTREVHCHVHKSSLLDHTQNQMSKSRLWHPVSFIFILILSPHISLGVSFATIRLCYTLSHVGYVCMLYTLLITVVLSLCILAVVTNRSRIGYQWTVCERILHSVEQDSSAGKLSQRTLEAHHRWKKSPRLNWATQFLTVAYDGACPPNVSVRMACVSFGALPCVGGTWWQLASPFCWKSRASPDMLPLSLCNKKRLAIRQMSRPPLSNDSIDSVLQHREVGRAKDLSAPPRNNVLSIAVRKCRWKTVQRRP